MWKTHSFFFCFVLKVVLILHIRSSTAACFEFRISYHVLLLNALPLNNIPAKYWMCPPSTDFTFFAVKFARFGKCLTTFTWSILCCDTILTDLWNRSMHRSIHMHAATQVKLFIILYGLDDVFVHFFLLHEMSAIPVTELGTKQCI